MGVQILILLLLIPQSISEFSKPEFSRCAVLSPVKIAVSSAENYVSILKIPDKTS